MSWKKIGQFEVSRWPKKWFENSSLQPTPVVLGNCVRVYCGFRDAKGASRVGYIDLDKKNPSQVLSVSETPCLDLGVRGAFDDSGVVPSAVLQEENKIYLYYAGYQIPRNIRFMVFGGLAVSEDGGETFKRCSKVPVLDRTNNELLFRVAHTVFKHKGSYHVFYGGGSDFENGKNKTLPKYDVRYLTSEFINKFPEEGKVIIPCNDHEHRLGRPYVLKSEDHFEMYFGYGTEVNPYWLTSAISTDLSEWKRNTTRLIPEGPVMNDDVMQAYPSVFQVNGKRYLLYNGNEYGKLGFVICEEN